MKKYTLEEFTAAIMDEDTIDIGYDYDEPGLVFHVHIGKDGILQNNVHDEIGSVKSRWDLTRGEIDRYFDGDFEIEEMEFIKDEVYPAYLDEYERIIEWL